MPRTELKRLAPGVCLHSPLRPSMLPSAVVHLVFWTPVIGLGSGGGGWAGGLGTAVPCATPRTTPGGRHDAGARVHFRKSADAGRLAGRIHVTL